MAAQLATFAINSLASSPNTNASRASPMLPTVKCSNCGEQVPMTDLGDHDRQCNPNAPKRKPSKSTDTPPLNTGSRLDRFRAQQSNQSPVGSDMSDPFASAGPPRITTPTPSRISEDRERERERFNRSPSRFDRNDRPYPQLQPQQPSSRPVRSPSASGPPPDRLVPINRSASDAGPKFSGISPISPNPPPPSGGNMGDNSNMAGVGRRAFAAAAQATLWATSHPQHRQSPSDHYYQPRPSTDLRPTQRSPYLETELVPDRETPPLSPNSPHSPHSPTLPQSPKAQTPSKRPSIASRTPSPPRRSPSPGFRLPSASPSVKNSSGRNDSISSRGTSSSAAGKLPFFEKYRNGSISSSASIKKSLDEPREDSYRPRGDSRSSPQPESVKSADSDTELSYARWGEDLQEESVSTRGKKDSIKFPASSSPPEVRTNARMASSHSSKSSVSSYTTVSAPPSRSHSRSAPTKDHSRTTSAAVPRDSGPTPMSPLLEEQLSDDEKPTHPTRSITSPSFPSSSSSSSGSRMTTKRTQEKVCVKCGTRIKDGKWIAIPDGKGVLCETDWKNLYLPKCRRCNLLIESKAVSSADGQLKGKYHKECFNCHACHKPFPDKTFYVFAGKPYCAYHYHLSNKSLCSQASCGNPIEGRCAEDHEGRRYHLTCFTCDEDDCGEPLEEYYEVDNGRRMCEKCWRKLDERSESSYGSGSAKSEDRDYENERKKEPSNRRPPPTTRAMKRQTRMVDLVAQ